MSKVKEYFNKRTSEQIFSLCLLIGIVVLMLFCAIVRLCGGLWFTADLSSIKEPNEAWREIIKGALLTFELIFVYKLLCRANWWICFIISVVETGIGIMLGYTISNEIVTNIFHMACLFIIPLPFVRHWFCLIDCVVLYASEILYSLLFMVGRIGSLDVNAGFNFVYSVLGAIDSKLFTVAIYLAIKYFGGIKLWKRQKRLILQKDLSIISKNR